VITLASPVTKGQAVSVIYQDPTISDDGDAIQDVAGNDSDGFAHLPVDNLTGGRPVITGVSIPNEPMSLGEVVTVTITVEPDADTYSLGPNSHVGPYALSALVKVNDTTYSAKFTVTELSGPNPRGTTSMSGSPSSTAPRIWAISTTSRSSRTTTGST
jgi:hypothetical protein